MISLFASPPTIGTEVHSCGVCLAEAVRAHIRLRFYGLCDSAFLHLVALLESPGGGATKDLWDLSVRLRYVPVFLVQYGRFRSAAEEHHDRTRVEFGWACR